LSEEEKRRNGVCAGWLIVRGKILAPFGKKVMAASDHRKKKKKGTVLLAGGGKKKNNPASLGKLGVSLGKKEKRRGPREGEKSEKSREEGRLSPTRKKKQSKKKKKGRGGEWKEKREMSDRWGKRSRFISFRRDALHPDDHDEGEKKKEKGGVRRLGTRTRGMISGQETSERLPGNRGGKGPPVSPNEGGRTFPYIPENDSTARKKRVGHVSAPGVRGWRGGVV